MYTNMYSPERVLLAHKATSQATLAARYPGAVLGLVAFFGGVSSFVEVRGRVDALTMVAAIMAGLAAFGFWRLGFNLDRIGSGLAQLAHFVTLMLPVEVRIIPTFQVVSDLGLLNSYVGLTLPLIASATATFLFRQFFLTVPDELVEAARIDGAGPLRFFKDVLLPLSTTSIAALFVIQFIYGWNQYLWPLLVTTSEDMYPVVIGIKRMIAGGDTGNEWNVVMATALLAMLPPALVVVFMQRWFVKGLVDTEK